MKDNNGTVNSESDNTLSMALKYMRLGWSVFPVAGKSKRPLIKWEKFQSIRADEEQIRAWCSQYPGMNIGVVTGTVSGIVVIDVDTYKGGVFPVTATTTATSGGGGKHYVFKQPAVPIRNSANFLAKYVDVKGEGGYIVVAPSIHENGNAYTWELPPWEVPPVDLPAHILQKLAPTKTRPETNWSKFVHDEVPEGMRNDMAIRYAGKITRDVPKEHWYTKGFRKLARWNAECCRPSLDDIELTKVFESACRMESARRETEPEKEDRKSQATKLTELVLGDPDISLFKDDFDTAYASFPVGIHRECWKINSSPFKRWLSDRFYDEYGIVPDSSAFKDAKLVIEAKAYRDGDEKKLSTRFAYFDDAVWYDLCDAEWRAVKITRAGWTIENNPPVLFRRHSHQSPQVDPVVGGKISDVLKYINVQEGEQEILSLVWLVTSFIPNFAHPLMYVHGPQGSAKSTLSRIMRDIVDPSRLEVLSMSKRTEELTQTLAHHPFIFFDNVSWIAPEVSDLLCKAVTGMGFSKRQLYTDDDDIIYNVFSTIGVNGINLVASKPDLLERSILMPLLRVTKEDRRQEHEILATFKENKARILGAIFTAVSHALKIKETVMIAEMPRMADFATWGSAAAQAIGYTQHEFLAAYAQNRDSQSTQIIDEHPEVALILNLMSGQDVWTGTMQSLLEELRGSFGINSGDPRHSGLPKTANALGRHLNTLKTSLEDLGIYISRDYQDKQRTITITKVRKNIVETVSVVDFDSEPNLSIDDVTDSDDGDESNDVFAE